MEKIDTIQVVKILAATSQDHLPFDTRIQHVCNGLVDLGFHSVRYYQTVTDNFADEPENFILTHASYSSGIADGLIGIRIPHSSTTLLSNSDGNSLFAFGDHSDSTEAQKSSWVAKLGIDV